MYQGDNPKAIRSQKWIADALLSIMKERPYNKITVRDICQKAELVRQTFYNCFDDKDDVLRFCLRNCYHEMFQKLNSKKNILPSDITDCFTGIFETHRELLGLLIDQKLEWLISEEVTAAMQDFTSKVSPKEDSRTDKYANAFLAGAMTQMIICWFKDNNRISTNELSVFLLHILSGNYYKL